jgi:hypothetical protein
MFDGCTSLTKAPDLPATTLAVNCYYAMFRGCTSLTEAPELPATTLELGCYTYMFEGCSRLQSIRVHFKEWYISLYNGCSGWLTNVAPTGIFYKPSELRVERGVDYIPEGWEVVNID